MMAKRMIYKSVLMGLGLVLGMTLTLNAQMSNTLYHMYGVPQSSLLNPARHPACKFYLGIPGMSPIRTSISTGGLSYGDVVLPHPTADSLILFLHPLGDRQAFLDQLKPLNVFSTATSVNLASIGFRTGIGYFNLGISNRVESEFYYPRDLFRLGLFGLADGESYDLSGLGVDLVAYDELSLGWSLPLGEMISFGFRARALFGLANFSTQRSEVLLESAYDQLNMQANLAMKASVPFASVVYDADGHFEDFLLNPDLETFHMNRLLPYFLNTKNMGAAIDLGLIVKPLEELELSISVLDIGGIVWRDEVHEFSYKLDYAFEGIELDPFDFPAENPFDVYIDSLVNQFDDTLTGAFSSSSGDPYARRLNPKLYVGASYYLSPRVNIGLLSRTDFLQRGIRQQFTASANVTTGRFLNLSLSYSAIDNNYKNMGAGLSIHLGVFNIYAVTNNGLSTLLWPADASSINFWLGFNLVFGCERIGRGARSDIPLLY